MSDRWRYRDVEGALYRLGQPAEARPAQAVITTPSGGSTPRSRAPSAPFQDQRLDVGMTAKQVLDAAEISDVRDHYILGIKRHGYKRRSAIIKKLVDTLNSTTQSRD